MVDVTFESVACAMCFRKIGRGSQDIGEERQGQRAAQTDEDVKLRKKLTLTLPKPCSKNPFTPASPCRPFSPSAVVPEVCPCARLSPYTSSPQSRKKAHLYRMQHLLGLVRDGIRIRPRALDGLVHILSPVPRSVMGRMKRRWKTHSFGLVDEFLQGGRKGGRGVGGDGVQGR